LFRFLCFAFAFIVASISVLTVRALFSERLARRVGPSVRRFAGRLICDAAGVRIRRRSHIAADAALVVSNHLSWLDAFVFLAELGPRFVAKSSWNSVPLLGTCLRAAGVIFITRTRLRDMHSVGRRLTRFASDGERAMVFPEADTSRGSTVLPFRGALLEPSAAGALPVGWAALRYETPRNWPPASVVVAWGDWTPILLHVYRAFHPPRITAQITYGADSVTGNNRKALAKTLHGLIVSAYKPMKQLSQTALKMLDVPPPVAPERY
jgi:1-acyl-sn-glycerol-3-phosphate acyltransferase